VLGCVGAAGHRRHAEAAGKNPRASDSSPGHTNPP
jgi:hypothetical protein